MELNTERIVYSAKKIEDLKDFKEVLDDASNIFDLKAKRVLNDILVAERIIPLSKRLKIALSKEIDKQITEEENKLVKIIKQIRLEEDADVKPDNI